MRLGTLVFLALLAIGTVLANIFISSGFWWALILVVPLVLVGFYDAFQTKHAITRNFPILGRCRYVAEWLRP